MTTIAKGVNVHLHPNADYSTVGLGKLAADPLLTYFSATGGLLFDLGCDLGWRTQAAPVNGATVPNLAGGAAGVITTTGAAPAFAGGGFDFGGCTAAPNQIQFAGVATEIQQTAAEEWLMVAYVRLPTDANWGDPGLSAALFSFGYYPNAVDLATFYMVNNAGTKAVGLRRGTASGASEGIGLPVAEGSKGAVCQLAGWRKGGRTYFSLQSAAEKTTQAPAASADNVGDFGALSLKVGLSTSASSPWSATLTASQLKARNWRLYRGALIDLAGISADVSAGLDADWARVLARGVFS